jgi:hypothetical protein
MVRAVQIDNLKQDVLNTAVISVAKQHINPNFPMGEQDNPGTMPWNVVRLGSSMFLVMPSLCMVCRYMMLMLMPLSTSTLLNRTLDDGPCMIGSTTRAYPPGFGITFG